MNTLKITIDQLKNYLGTGLKWKLIEDVKEELWEYEDNQGFDKAFEIGSLWEMAGYTDVLLCTDEGHELQGFLLHHPETGFWMNDKSSFRPICYRLSDLDKFIPEWGFVPIEELLRMSYTAWFAKNEGTRYSEVEKEQTPNYIRANVTYMATFLIEIYKPNIDNEKWWIVQQLLQWHFWPFGENYFEQGLIIDKLKLQDQ